MNYQSKLLEYKSLFNFQHEFYGRDFKNNLKFVQYSINKMLKQNTDVESICDFIQDTIDIHKRIYM